MTMLAQPSSMRKAPEDLTPNPLPQRERGSKNCCRILRPFLTEGPRAKRVGLGFRHSILLGAGLLQFLAHLAAAFVVALRQVFVLQPFLPRGDGFFSHSQRHVAIGKVI